MFLTIAGKLGSGKSTICKIISDKYGFEIYSTGKIQRDIANSMGISTLQLNELMRMDSKYDDLIDKEVVRISQTRKKDNIIFDSRMAFHFVENSYDIFTIIDPREAAKRVMLSPRGSEEVYQNEEMAQKKLLERADIENVRFKEIYHVDNSDYDNYNLIVDTSWCKPEELADLIYKKACDDLEKTKQQILISPKSLYPTEKISNINMEIVGQYRNKMKKGFNEKVLVRVFENYHYIVDGHHKVIAALLENKQFIEASLLHEKNNFLDKSKNLISELEHVGKSTLYDFEDIAKFRYISYPEYY